MTALPARHPLVFDDGQVTMPWLQTFNDLTRPLPLVSPLDPATATTADIANKLNEIINAMKQQGKMEV